MSRLDRILAEFKRTVSLPWKTNLAGPQRVWMVVYDPADERRLRARLGEFELAAQEAEHPFMLCDLTDSFPAWMAAQEYLEDYFEDPEDLELVLPEFLDFAADQVRAVMQRGDDDTLVAVLGVGALFGFIRVSELLNELHKDIQGRLVVFFPGNLHGNTYRLLDARDGWNYLAVPITA